LLVGSKGMLGHDFEVALSKDKSIQLWAVDREDFDITRPKLMATYITGKSIDLLINCSAYTAVDQAEVEHDRCDAINVDGLNNLVTLCEQNHIKLLHFSTDYVFNGLNEKGYDEGDQCDPINYYGKSKYLAEQSVANLPGYLIIRTAWLYGHNGPNFVETMKKLFKSKSELTVVNDQVGSPTNTVDLVTASLELIKRNASGIYHLVNSGFCTWFDFATEIKRITDSKVVISPCSSSVYKTLAKRPSYSKLITTKYQNKTGLNLRPWQVALKEYLINE
jgi:dTDP-4-dehydrorhamnose reductase